jgi:predicted Zn-dependent protease
VVQLQIASAGSVACSCPRNVVVYCVNEERELRDACMPAQGTELRIRETLGLAAASAKQGDLEATMGHARKVLSLDPGNEIALGLLSGIYMQLNLRDRAESCLREVLSAHPRNVLARYQLGLMQFEAGQLQAALDTWAAALEDDEEFMCHFHSALALLQLKQPQPARALLEHCAPRIPRNHELYPRLQELLEQLRS